MIVIGLTGSIGMGKSLTAAMLRRMGCDVHHADMVVHHLLAPGGQAVMAVAAAFPGTLRGDGAIDRKTLGSLVFGQPELRRRLEGILHPLVREEEGRKHKRALEAGRRFLVLDIPLLFETDGDKRCDVTFCVTASATQQRARVLARPGMDEEKFQAILAAQMPDAEKRARADIVIYTGLGRCFTWWQLRLILAWLSFSKQP